MKIKAGLVEYLTYEERGDTQIPVFYLNWKAAVAMGRSRQRRFTSVEVRSGKVGEGPQIAPEVRELLCATYLRPLRDAERGLSAGRGSRLSQILQYSKEITEHGQDFDPEGSQPVDPRDLSVLGIGDWADSLLADHPGIKKEKDRLNTEFLRNLSFSDDPLQGSISVSGSRRDATIRFRHLLEKLELELHDHGVPEPPPNRGLGSNNLLFMACELLLLGSDDESFPLLLIEEPEAHWDFAEVNPFSSSTGNFMPGSTIPRLCRRF